MALKAAIAPFASLLFLCGSPQAPASTSPAQASFEGIWSVNWCDRDHPDSDCGGFTALLVQDGERVCGRFGAARPGLTQIDEGEPRSVRGVVVKGSAVVVVTSGRSDGSYLVRLDREGSNMRWRMVEQVGVPDNADIQLIALHDELTRVGPSRERDQLAIVREECAR